MPLTVEETKSPFGVREPPWSAGPRGRRRSADHPASQACSGRFDTRPFCLFRRWPTAHRKTKPTIAWTTAYRRRASTAPAPACREPATAAPLRLPLLSFPVRPAVVSRAGIGMHDHMIDGRPEHRRDFAAQRLRILIMHVDVHRAVSLDIRNGHGRANGRVLHVGQLIGGGKFLVSRGQRGTRVPFILFALGDRRGCSNPLLPADVGRALRCPAGPSNRSTWWRSRPARPPGSLPTPWARPLPQDCPSR